MTARPGTARLALGPASAGRRAGRPELVVVGSASRDLAADDPRGWRLGGGVSYAALAAARLGVRTAAVIGLDAEAAAAAEIDLLVEAGVDLLRVLLPVGTVLRNMKRPGGRVQVCIELGAPIPLVPLPDSWRAAPAWLVVPISGEVGDEWAAAIPAAAAVAVGWQGLLRDLAPGRLVRPRPPASSALLDRAGLVAMSETDVEPGVSLREVVTALQPGAWLVVTRGARGGLLVRVEPSGPGAAMEYTATPARREVDPVGAGDTFLAALVAGALHPRGAGGRRRGTLDLAFASAAASLAVEAVGMAGPPDRGEVLERLAAGPSVQP